MPLSSPRSAAAVLEAACAEAWATARWDRADLATRRPDAGPGALLLAKAVECASSPVAREQLLSLAIERVAGDADDGAPLIEARPDPGGRAGIAAEVSALEPRAAEIEAAAALIESRHARRPATTGEQRDRLAAQLREDALLHEMLWDHPDLAASPAVRRAMLGAIPRLRERADQLTTRTTGWFSNLKARLRPSRAGVVR